jgi:hypothetical protein
MVSLKLYHRGEVRGVDIPRNISFADLNSALLLCLIQFLLFLLFRVMDGITCIARY